MNSNIIYTSNYKSLLGNILLASDGRALIGLWIEGQKYFFNYKNEKVIENDNLEIFKKTKNWLDRYFNKEKPEISELLLEPIGNQFRQEVWKILCNIPYGTTVTYGAIAKEIAKKMNKKSMSAQAVGNAVGHNPISIIIPCHRVVGVDGNLTGYAGGIDKKIKLLTLEDVDINKFFYLDK